MRFITLLLITTLTTLLTPFSTALATKPASPTVAAPVNEKEEARKLPREDIKRFITSIAIIDRYYVKNVEMNTLFDYAIEGMVQKLDPHSTYLTPEDMKDLDMAITGEYVGIGVEITQSQNMLKVVSPIDDTPASKAGLQPGDMIFKVDGQLVQDLTLREAVSKIKGKANTKVTLTILRSGEQKPLEVVITRQKIKLKSVRSRLIDDHYGYFRITFFQGPVTSQLKAAISKIKKEAHNQLWGVVLDLRNNPGGLLDASTDVSDLFLTASETKKYKGNIVYTKGRAPGSNLSIKAKPKNMLPNIPMVVIVNSGSASASEIVAGALQDYKRAVIVGTRTFGKGSVQTVIPLSDKYAIKLTTALYYTPAGQKIQARGIIPNITVPALTIDKLPEQWRLDESEYSNVLMHDSDAKKIKSEKEKRQKLIQNQLALAKKDYQLYESLLVLQGLRASR